MKKIIAAIYPIPINLVERFFSENKDVFVKYLRTSTVRLSPKNKIIFYASHGSQELVGEGLIETIEFLTSDEVLEKYITRVFLKKRELEDYIHSQPLRTSSKKMLTVAFSRIKKYDCPIKIVKPVNMGGQYLTKDDYLKLIGHKK